MLRSLIFLLFSITYLESKAVACRTSSSYELARKNDSYQSLKEQSNILKVTEFNDVEACQVVLKNLKNESIEKVENLKKTREFQKIVAEFQNNEEVPKSSFSSELAKSQESRLNEQTLHIFISFSMGEKALLNLAQEAKRFNAILVLRGFKDGSYKKTAQSLQNIITKTGQGVIVDPELFTLFNVTNVPTYVLAKPFNINAMKRIQTPIHDKLQGHVSVQYALETFSKEGDLKEEAKVLLKRGTIQ